MLDAQDKPYQYARSLYVQFGTSYEQVTGALPQIEKQAQLERRTVGQMVRGVSKQHKSGKRTLSPAARAHIAKAQRERWRKFKAAKKG